MGSRHQKNKSHSLALENDDDDIKMLEISDINTTGNAVLQSEPFPNMGELPNKRSGKGKKSIKLDITDAVVKKRLENCYILAWKLGRYFATCRHEEVKQNSDYDSTDDVQEIPMISELDVPSEAIELEEEIKQKDEKNAQEDCGYPIVDNPLQLSVSRAVKRGQPQTQSSTAVAKRMKMDLESDSGKYTDNTFEGF